jgi:hypothetical protein
VQPRRAGSTPACWSYFELYWIDDQVAGEKGRRKGRRKGRERERGEEAVKRRDTFGGGKE